MHEFDLNRVKFYPQKNIAAEGNLQKGEHILKTDIKSSYSDINEVLELYNIKKYIDNELYLKTWTQGDIYIFKQKATEYGIVVRRFISTIDDTNVINLYDKTLRLYIHSFWELINDQSAFKRISKPNFINILSKEPHPINEILINKHLVDYYDTAIKDFLLTYPQSAEILLSIYEVKHEIQEKRMSIPKSLSIKDNDSIFSNYLDSTNVNYNYILLIQNAKNINKFIIAPKTRLKAKRLYKSETAKFFADNKGMKYGASISFPEKVEKIKEVFLDENLLVNYSYSLQFIKKNNSAYSLFQNFTILFEYLDVQNRIALVSKKDQILDSERYLGVQSKHEYKVGTAFNLSEMTSHLQIVSYQEVVSELNNSLENILHHVFTSSFKEKYDFADNARFLIPSATSYLEKVSRLAIEFESVLKQYKHFVEDGSIDFDLIEISSSTTNVNCIPSLNRNKYIYFNEGNKDMVSCSNLFFSDHTFLGDVEPFKEKKYRNFFSLLKNEKVNFSNYDEYQKPELNYLLDKGFISLDNNNIIQINNPARVIILKDLYSNEVASFYRYSLHLRQEAQQMEAENIVRFESSLFSEPEQAYFNYFLNKSAGTNGLDLRNSYIHGSQGNPEEIQKHKDSYFRFLKFLFLTLLKIEDDLVISKVVKNNV
jgi:hypothetical protein